MWDHLDAAAGELSVLILSLSLKEGSKDMWGAGLTYMTERLFCVL